MDTNTVDKTDALDTILEKLDTLDIILFHGTNYLFSSIVEFFSMSSISHIGIVLRDPIYIDPKLTGLYLLESGKENFPDAENGVDKFGVQIVDLKEKIRKYGKGKIYSRKLNSELMKQHIEETLTALHKIIHDKPYDTHIKDFIKAEFGLEFKDYQRVNNFFCSALVGCVYTCLGLLGSETDWDMLKPAFFNTSSKKLLQGDAYFDDRKLIYKS